MFACIYFEEDRSISVVGQKDKDLKVVEGRFETRANVEMIWKINQDRKLFHGTIIRTHEDKKVLDDFAQLANKNVVQPNIKKPYQIAVDLLLVYDPAEKTSGKRERKLTEIAKESQEQDEEVSPKKKAKKQAKDSEKEKSKEDNGGSMENGVSPKKKTKKQAKDQEKEKQADIKNKSAKKKIELATNLNTVNTNKDIIQYCNLYSQFEDDYDNTNPTTEETALSAVGRQVVNATSIVQGTYPTDGKSFMKIPVPPPEIIAFFKALDRPDVRAFVQAFSSHFDQAISHDHQFYETVSVSQDMPYYQQMDNTCSYDSSGFSSSFNQPQHSAQSSVLPSGSVGTQSSQQQYPNSQFLPPGPGTFLAQNSTFLDHSTFQSPLSSFQHVQGHQTFLPQTQKSAPVIATATSASGEASCLNQNQLRLSDRLEFHEHDPSEQEFDSLNQDKSSTTDMIEAKNQDTNTLANNLRRTSPRKNSNLYATKDSKREQLDLETRPSPASALKSVDSPSEKMVKIVEGHPYMVSSSQLWKLTSKCRKDRRPGYSLVLKLMPMIFTVEEMSSSRGQGIKQSKKGDEMKPILDAEKIKVIKAYAEGYCKKHSLPASSDAEMNIAVTEAIAYARKKMKKQLSAKQTDQKQ